MFKPMLRSSLLALCALFAIGLLLGGCATDIAGPPDSNAGAAEVPGAATPAPNANSAGWW
jgi:hypothetical protein